MTHHFTADTQTFWIAHSEDTLEHGVLGAGESLDAGQPYLETYTSPREWNRRLTFLRKNYDAALSEWLETLRLRDPLAKLADYRWRKETGGVECPSGMVLCTTRESQAQMASTIVSLQEGIIEGPVPWKAQNGWFVMDLAEMKVAAAATALHVAHCFTAEQMVQEQIADDAEIDVIAAFDAAYASMRPEP